MKGNQSCNGCGLVFCECNELLYSEKDMSKLKAENEGLKEQNNALDLLVTLQGNENAGLKEQLSAMKKAMNEVALWLKAALDCPDFHWDGDQREAAEQALLQVDSEARVNLSPTGRYIKQPNPVIQNLKGRSEKS